MPEPRSIGPVKPSCMRALRRHDADVHRALLPDAVVGEQRLVLVDARREALGEVLDEIEHASRVRRSLSLSTSFCVRHFDGWYFGIESGRSRYTPPGR